MRALGIVLPILLSSVAVAAVQQARQPAAPVAAASQTSVHDINYALADWRRLRASSGYAFADYARFVNANPGWPNESAIRRAAEKQMRPGENANLVLAFFRTIEPQSGNGWARLAEAHLASGNQVEALAAAKGAWLSSDL